MVNTWPRDGQGMVKRVVSKRQAYLNSVKAPLISRALAITVAPLSPILLEYNL